jgi:hypothetical protein
MSGAATAGDSVCFTQSETCDATSGPATTVKTEEYVLSTGPNELITLPGNLAAGDWTFCYKPVGSGAVWTAVPAFPLRIDALPTTFFPFAVTAGSVTDLTFTATDMAVGGDYVVIKETSCADAANTSATSLSLPRTVIEADLIVTLSSTMKHGVSGGVLLYICFASQESGGNSDDDYSQFPIPLNFMPPPVYTPQRTVAGATQTLDVTGGNSGDWIVWTTAPNCTGSFDPGPPTATRTGISRHWSSYGQSQELEFPTAGTWHLCHKINGMKETLIVGGDLIVIPQPTFEPKFGDAGSITRISFNGAKDGDWVVMTSNGCNTNPESTTTSVNSLGKTVVNSSQPLQAGRQNASLSGFFTVTEMTSATSLYICYATAESLGDHYGDYVDITSTATR